jgi:DNA-binding transcriptional LysR family regulator
MLDVRRLRVLAEVAERGSFSAAAGALRLTQSAVSQHVAALEREVGLALVERGTRPVELTEAGHALTRHASGIFARLEGAEQELGEIAGRRAGRLRLGSIPTALATFVPAAFRQFRRRHGEVTLTVVDDPLQRLVPRLESELDLALIYEHPALPEIAALDLDRTPLLDDTFQVALPSRHRLTRRRRPLALADLAGEEWIGGSPTSAWFRIVTHHCRAAGFIPRSGYAADDNVAVQALVAAGLGIAVIPGLALAHPRPGVEVRSLGADAPVRVIEAVRARDGYRSPPVSAMLECLRSAVRGAPPPHTRPAAAEAQPAGS